MATFLASAATIERKWYVVDADGQTLGRLAARVASVLRGKHKPTFTPNVDAGDHVVVVNAEKIVLTGDKMRTKTYSYHTGYPGGLKTLTAEHVHSKNPTELVTRAIKGMLPKTPLGKQMARKLRVYADAEHPHTSQNPQSLKTQR
jgi:large subunit ribosomal protein L13